MAGSPFQLSGAPSLELGAGDGGALSVDAWAVGRVGATVEAVTGDSFEPPATTHSGSRDPGTQITGNGTSLGLRSTQSGLSDPG